MNTMKKTITITLNIITNWDEYDVLKDNVTVYEEELLMNGNAHLVVDEEEYNRFCKWYNEEEEEE